MYTKIAEEAIKDATMITGTLLIHSSTANTLFDYGGTHTYIAKTFVNRISVFVEDLGYDLVVLTPTEAVLTIKMCVSGVVWLSNNASVWLIL